MLPRGPQRARELRDEDETGKDTPSSTPSISPPEVEARMPGGLTDAEMSQMLEPRDAEETAPGMC